MEHAGVKKLCNLFFLPLVIPACHHHHRLDFVAGLGSSFVRGRNGFPFFLFFPLRAPVERDRSLCHSKTDTSQGEQLPKSWWHVGQILKKGFVSSQAQVCANGRSWTTTMPGLPTPSDYFPVGTFFFQWEAGAKVADICCLAGKAVLVSADIAVKRQWLCHCTLRTPPKKLLLSLLQSRFWSERVQSAQ